MLFATLPVLLTGLAVLSFFGLQETWSTSLGPDAKAALSDDTFSVLDRTIESILTGRRAEWLTIGLVLTIWRVSALIRTTTSPLNLVYGCTEDRPWIKRQLASILVAAVVLPCALAGMVGIVAGDHVLEALGLGGAGGVLAWVARWLLVLVLLLSTVWLVLRVAPARRPEVHYVSLGAGIVVGGWVVATLVYAYYATSIANYDSVFGSLASLVILITYAYILAMAFLVGIAADAALHRRMRD